MRYYSYLTPVIFVALGSFTIAAPSAASGRSPTVQLDQGTFTGVANITFNMFLGIPFAKPPTGDLRFRPPVANDPYTGSYNATAFGLSCPQQSTGIPWIPVMEPFGEDCLTVNVWAPIDIPAGTKIPVVAWIYGDAFQRGTTTSPDGSVIVNRSVELGQPIMYVSMNYRVNAFGFLASQEVKDAGAGNLGLRDQRQALHWIQKYISAFNGDPTRVTIWGGSAGAISVALQMLTNGGNTEGLFHGAFMNSGSPLPVGDITHGQKYYDALVAETGCSSSLDTLQCLRRVPFDTLMKAVNMSPSVFSYQSLDLAWTPRTDGVFLTDDPQKLVQAGSVASIPFVTGDCDDEGTLFSLVLSNITTEAQLRTYLTTYYMPNASSSQLDQLLTLYPEDPAQGSPFDTGCQNELFPQYKRLAALQGDLVFQAPRRFFLRARSGRQSMWSFLSKRMKDTPWVGALHGSDTINMYDGDDMADYLINFVDKRNPNGNGLQNWPKYDILNPWLLTFLDGPALEISRDTYRIDGMDLLTQLSLENPL